MENSKIRELLLADGWEEVTGDNVEEGDYVAVLDEIGRWHEGYVGATFTSGDCRWLGETAVIREEDSALRAPKDWPHLDRRFNKSGKEFINISQNPRDPKYIETTEIDYQKLYKETIFGPPCPVDKLAVDPKRLTKEKPE